MMERSSGDIFRNFIATGTNNSMVVGYESQIVEFIVANPDSRELIQDTSLRPLSRADRLELAPGDQPERQGRPADRGHAWMKSSEAGLERTRFPLRPGRIERRQDGRATGLHRRGDQLRHALARREPSCGFLAAWAGFSERDAETRAARDRRLALVHPALAWRFPLPAPRRNGCGSWRPAASAARG